MSDVVEQRIARISQLLDRLDHIPGELDQLNRRLFDGGLTREEFARLVDRRSALLIEQERVEKELKETYKMI